MRKIHIGISLLIVVVTFVVSSTFHSHAQGGGLNPELSPEDGSGSATSDQFVNQYVTATAQAGGNVSLADITNKGCVGYVAAAPNFLLTWTQVPSTPAANLRVFFAADVAGQDTTMLILGPNNIITCIDDHGELRDPLIDIESPQSGDYFVWVGTFDAATTISGTLYITTSSYDPANKPLSLRPWDQFLNPTGHGGSNTPTAVPQSVTKITPVPTAVSAEPTYPIIPAILEVSNQRSALRSVAFAPNGGWVILHGQGAVKWWGIPQVVEDKIRELTDAGEQIKQIAFGPNNQWIILFGTNGFARSGNLPEDLVNYLTIINDNGAVINQVLFNPSGNGWLVIYNDSSFQSSGMPSDLTSRLTEITLEGYEIVHVALRPYTGKPVGSPPPIGWVVIYGPQTGWGFDFDTRLPRDFYDHLRAIYDAEDGNGRRFPIKSIAFRGNQGVIFYGLYGARYTLTE